MRRSGRRSAPPLPLTVGRQSKTPRYRQKADPADARPALDDQLAGFQMMTFLVGSSPGAGATLP
jgi:hypothetical protein